MSEFHEIAALRRDIAAVAEQIAEAQALLQRLQAERSVLEGELRGFEAAQRLKRGKEPPEPANDS
jgi:hypothetical protein